MPASSRKLKRAPKRMARSTRSGSATRHAWLAAPHVSECMQSCRMRWEGEGSGVSPGPTWQANAASSAPNFKRPYAHVLRHCAVEYVLRSGSLA